MSHPQEYPQADLKKVNANKNYDELTVSSVQKTRGAFSKMVSVQ